MRRPICILLLLIMPTAPPSTEPPVQSESTIIETTELGYDGDTMYYYVLDKETGCTLYIDDGEPRVLEVFQKPYEEEYISKYLDFLRNMTPITKMMAISMVRKARNRR